MQPLRAASKDDRIRRRDLVPGSVAGEVARTLYEGSVWIVLGFAIAGALHVLVDPARLVRHLGQRSLGACLRAALLGAPIPLCSYGVLPELAAVSASELGAASGSAPFEALAFQDQRLNAARGDADRFARLAAEHERSPALLEKRLYLETAERVLPRVRRYVLEPGGAKSIPIRILE